MLCYRAKNGNRQEQERPDENHATQNHHANSNVSVRKVPWFRCRFLAANDPRWPGQDDRDKTGKEHDRSRSHIQWHGVFSQALKPEPLLAAAELNRRGFLKIRGSRVVQCRSAPGGGGEKRCSSQDKQ